MEWSGDGREENKVAFGEGGLEGRKERRRKCKKRRKTWREGRRERRRK